MLGNKIAENIELMLTQMSQFKDEGKRIFCTSSFQSQSLVLLHILSESVFDLPVCFINTGYHFPETLGFRDRVVALLGLNLFEVGPSIPKSEQIGRNGKLLYAYDPDLCCHVNKVMPLQKILGDYDVWVSGVRRDQTNHRQGLKTIEDASEAIRFRPMLDWTHEMMQGYVEEYNLPSHPLENNRLAGIGCEPCTRIDIENIDDSARGHRWCGLSKNECGIHTFKED